VTDDDAWQALDQAGAALAMHDVRELIDHLVESALIARPVWGADGTIADFAIEHLSPGYVDPAGRPATDLMRESLLAAYPGSGGWLFTLAAEVLTSGTPKHVPGPVGGFLSDGEQAVEVADLRAMALDEGVIITWHQADRVAGRDGGAASRDPRDGGSVPPRGVARDLSRLIPHPALSAPAHGLASAAGDAPDGTVADGTAADAAVADRPPDDGGPGGLAMEDDPLGADQPADGLAIRVRRALMPPDRALTAAAGVEIAVGYRPADGGRKEVSGDWYDVFPMAGGDLLLVIGDIAGHGQEAVHAMDRAREALRALISTGASPGDLLSQLNSAALQFAEASTGTVICGRYQPETQVLRWARAGHLPPVLVRDGTAEPLDLPEGMLLGVSASAAYEEATVRLRAGDTLLLYTDGLIERRAGSISDSLADFATAAVPAGPDAAGHVARIMAGAASDTGDDACLLALRVLPIL
jgi:hypothetical protein